MRNLRRCKVGMRTSFVSKREHTTWKFVTWSWKWTPFKVIIYLKRGFCEFYRRKRGWSARVDKKTRVATKRIGNTASGGDATTASKLLPVPQRSTRYLQWGNERIWWCNSRIFILMSSCIWFRGVYEGEDERAGEQTRRNFEVHGGELSKVFLFNRSGGK